MSSGRRRTRSQPAEAEELEDSRRVQPRQLHSASPGAAAAAASVQPPHLSAEERLLVAKEDEELEQLEENSELATSCADVFTAHLLELHLRLRQHYLLMKTELDAGELRWISAEKKAMWHEQLEDVIMRKSGKAYREWHKEIAAAVTVEQALAAIAKADEAAKVAMDKLIGLYMKRCERTCRRWQEALQTTLQLSWPTMMGQVRHLLEHQQQADKAVLRVQETLRSIQDGNQAKSEPNQTADVAQGAPAAGASPAAN
jgi:hypothetical protein